MGLILFPCQPGIKHISHKPDLACGAVSSVLWGSCCAPEFKERVNRGQGQPLNSGYGTPLGMDFGQHSSTCPTTSCPVAATPPTAAISGPSLRAVQIQPSRDRVSSTLLM